MRELDRSSGPGGDALHSARVCAKLYYSIILSLLYIDTYDPSPTSRGDLPGTGTSSTRSVRRGVEGSCTLLTTGHPSVYPGLLRGGISSSAVIHATRILVSSCYSCCLCPRTNRDVSVGVGDSQSGDYFNSCRNFPLLGRCIFGTLSLGVSSGGLSDAALCHQFQAEQQRATLSWGHMDRRSARRHRCGRSTHL